MSATPADQQAYANAYYTLHDRVYAPTFFEKLANDFGIRPENEDDARRMLTMATQLREAHDKEAQAAQAKQPKYSDFLKAAEARLQAQLGVADTNDDEQLAEMDYAAKEAAAYLSFDADVAAAALTMQTC